MENSIAKELQNNPDLAEQILTMAGKMGAAVMANRIRQLERDADAQKKRIKECERQMRGEVERLEQSIKLLTDRTHAAFERIKETQK